MCVCVCMCVCLRGSGMSEKALLETWLQICEQKFGGDFPP
jgi:hypothetical protein